MHYLDSKNNGADQLCGAFVYANAKVRFSHDAAHFKNKNVISALRLC